MKNTKLLLVLATVTIMLNLGTAAYLWLYIKREHYAAAIAKGHGVLNVRDYGAKCDGVSDDSDAFNAAMEDGAAKHATVVIPGGTCLLNSQVLIRSGNIIRSEGATLKHGRGGGRLLASVSTDDWTLQGPLTLVGTRNPNAKEGNETGLFISGSNRYMVDKLTVRDFRGTGIEMVGGKPTRAARGDRGKFAFITLINNHTGISMDAGKKYSAEYNLFTLMTFSGNDVAARIVSGNNVITASNIVDNANGLLLQGGLNHGHGIVNSVNINHNPGYNVRMDEVTKGYTFNGCHIYGDNDNSVIMGQAQGVDFSGCVLDPQPKR